MKKLLVFTENFARGGGNKYLIDLVNAGASMFESIDVASNSNGFYPGEKQQFNFKCKFRNISFFTSPVFLSKFGLLASRHFFVNLIRLFFLLLDPVFMLINILVFCIFLRKSKPDRVLCANGGYPASRACIAMVFAAKLMSVPVLLSIVSMPAPKKQLMVWYEKFIDGLVWYSVTAVIVNANAIAKALAVSRNMPTEKAKVVYNGLPLVTTQLQEINRESSLTIGYIARLDAAKGVFNLFDAFRSLLKSYPTLKLTLVGAGDGSEKMAQLVRECGLNESVTLAGHFSGDVSQLLPQFDIFVFPSLWEGFPYSILEAMRSGLPIISSNVGGVSEAIVDGVDGLLVPAGSVDALSQSLARLIDDQNLRLQLSTNARQRFEKDFTLTRMTSRVEEILQELS